MLDIKNAINSAYDYSLKYVGQGEVASYIPELAKANSNHLAISIMDCENNIYNIGDCDVRFTIQSIGKIIGLLVTLEQLGEQKVFSVVGMEASGDPFNSMVRIETGSSGKPSNPMINAGAIAVCSLIPGENSQERFNLLLDNAKVLLGDKDISLDQKVYLSEKQTGSRNKSMAYLMNANGIINGDIDEHLDLYFKLCSLLVTSKSMAYLGAVLAKDGIDPLSGKQLVSQQNARIVRAIMVTAGMYDGSGEFAVKIGCPSKSGVGGGIMSAISGKMGIGVFSPALDSVGNSLAGQKALQSLSKELDLFVY